MSDDVQFLINHAAKQISEAIKKLNEAKTYLDLASMEKESESVNEIIELTQLSFAHVKPVAVRIKNKKLLTKHKLQDFFIDTWMRNFPEYGKPSPREWKAVKMWFIQLSTSHPAATEEFIQRLVSNYRRSTAGWCEVKQLTTFCNNFRHFIHKPQIGKNDLQKEPEKKVSEEVLNKNDGIEYRSIPGLRGVVIPVKRE